MTGGDGSTALLTDHYELTMLRAALPSRRAHHRAVFVAFARHLPAGRRYGVVAGTGRLLEALERFRFDAATLQHLVATGVIDEPTRTWLADYRFSGNIDGYAEGELYFPDSPVLVVEATFGEAVLLETLVASILNHDSAVASAAARILSAAGERPCVEFGSRRTHEQAAVAAARAAYLVGFASTSNLEAGRRYGIPTAGTSAHAFTLVHASEQEAFAAQVGVLGAGTTLLVDTFEEEQAIRIAVEVAGPRLGAVRLDSGDLLALARQARRLLDSLGATGTRIMVTGDLDEHAIAALASAPVDTYGVGTSVVMGTGAPTAGFVYKLVARANRPGEDAPLEPVAKKSHDKATRGGRPVALRRRDGSGTAVAEVVATSTPPPSDGGARPLLVPLVRDGKVVARPGLDEIRRHHRRAVAELPGRALQLSRGAPALPTVHLPG